MRLGDTAIRSFHEGEWVGYLEQPTIAEIRSMLSIVYQIRGKIAYLNGSFWNGCPRDRFVQSGGISAKIDRCWQVRDRCSLVPFVKV